MLCIKQKVTIVVNNQGEKKQFSALIIYNDCIQIFKNEKFVKSLGEAFCLIVEVVVAVSNDDPMIFIKVNLFLCN